MKKSIWWKIYFWPICVLLVADTIERFIIEEFNLFLMVDQLFGILALVGMFGYIYNRRFISKGFWMVFLPLMIGWEVIYDTFINPPAIEFEPIIMALILLFAIPVFILLFLYGYRSAELWKNKT